MLLLELGKAHCRYVLVLLLLAEYYYRVGQKSKPTLSTHNFVKYWPIFNILSLFHSAGNLQ